MTVVLPTNSLAAENKRAPSPRRSRFSSFSTLYFLTLRQHMHGKRWMILAILFLLPAALAWIVRATTSHVPGIDLEFIFVFMFIPQALLPLVALVYASGIIQDELEEQTITYLLIRPIPKWAIYWMKLLATLTTTVVLTAFFTALTYAVIYVGTHPAAGNIIHRCVQAIWIHALAVITYCCLFALLSLVTRRVLFAGILYIAIFEGLFANLPFGIRLVTIIYYARVIAYRMLSFVSTFHHMSQNIAANAWQFDVDSNRRLIDEPHLATCIAVLLGTSFVCTLLGCLLCTKREFHVKTPEKT